MKPTNPDESWRILANLYYINVLWMEVKDSRILLFFKRFVSWIRFVLRCSKDSFRGFVSSYGVQKIRFVDSFCDTIFVRFVSWIRFVRPKISKDSIRFVLEGFVYESRILKIDAQRKKKWRLQCKFWVNNKIFTKTKSVQIKGRGSERRRSERRQAKNFRTSKWSF